MLKHILKYSRVYFIVISSVAVLSMVVIGNTAYRGTKAAEERNLIARAQTIARLVEPREIAFLAGNESDKNSPFYISLKESFIDIKKSNEDTRFLYLAGMRNGDIFFYLDSESERSLDYSPPGQKYDEASNVFKESFISGYSRFEGPLKDRWGNWISAFAPIRHPGTGKVIAVLGMDVSASEYYKNIFSAALIPNFFILLFWAIFFIFFKSYKKEAALISIKEELVSIASHDIRSPLLGLSWSLETLLRDKTIPENSDSRIIILKMDKALKEILGTVKILLDSSRLEESKLLDKKLAPIDLRRVISKSIDILVLFAEEKNVMIHLSGDWPENILIAGDEEKIKQAISNIISNGIKYSSVGGTINIYYHQDAGSHIISFSNAGPEIPVSERSKIFSKFFRVDNVAAIFQLGSGLGLYFTKQIIEAHKGKIWFDSKMGETVFHISLPKYVKD